MPCVPKGKRRPHLADVSNKAWTDSFSNHGSGSLFSSLKNVERLMFYYDLDEVHVACTVIKTINTCSQRGFWRYRS